MLDPSILPATSAVRTAAVRLRPVLSESRLSPSPALSSAAGVPVWLKCEFENPTGSFKVRGAFNTLAEMTGEERDAGVVASSAGNHGLGVAYAAKAFGVPAFIYVPCTAPEVKKEGIRALGAQVDDSAANYDDAMTLAKARAARDRVRFINPCLGLELLAGQGTVGLEILGQRPTVANVLVCTGGGGLLGGVGAVLRDLAPHVRVVGVQSEETAAMTNSVRSGRVVYAEVTPTLADGLAGQIDDEALYIGQRCADDLVLVSEGEIADAIAWLAREEGFTIEGAGAVTVAALLHGRVPNLAGETVAIVSGRNIDPGRHRAIVERGRGWASGADAPTT